MSNEEHMKYLKKFWHEALKYFKVNNDQIHYSFELIENMYRGRHYHTLDEHIFNVFGFIILCRGLECDGLQAHKLEEFYTLILAAFLHDVVYQSTDLNDNEKNSADFACTFLRLLGVNDLTSFNVKELILTTKDHKPLDKEKDYRLYRMSCIMIDADFNIMSDEGKFREASEQVRKEYYWVDDKTFYTARLAFMNKMLEREQIYYTGCNTGGSAEEMARNNIKEEIERLKEKIKNG